VTIFEKSEKMGIHLTPVTAMDSIHGHGRISEDLDGT
jgi:hypothetical protein